MLFGGKTSQEKRFSGGEWADDMRGIPVLTDALVSFGGAIVETARIGSHDILFVGVNDVRISGDHGRGLIYFGRKFHEIG